MFIKLKDDNLTIDVVAFEDPNDPAFIKIDGSAFGGDTYDASTGIVTPQVQPPTPRRDTGSAREFMDLFTSDEKTTIVTLTMNNATIKLWYDEALAGDVWLGHPSVSSGLSAMVSSGVLTLERTEYILAWNFDD